MKKLIITLMLTQIIMFFWGIYSVFNENIFSGLVKIITSTLIFQVFFKILKEETYRN